MQGYSMYSRTGGPLLMAQKSEAVAVVLVSENPAGLVRCMPCCVHCAVKKGWSGTVYMLLSKLAVRV